MKQRFLLKLIFRSWWRNKLFATISLISLAIGITCTNLLITFVVHEYTIESSNPNKERILRLTQEVPVMKESKQGTFVYGGSVPDIVSPFPEIEKFLRMDESQTIGIKIGETEHPKQLWVKADTCLTDFFPFESIYGSLPDVLSKPGTVALSEELARTYFGEGNYANQTIDIVLPDTILSFAVSAVFKPYPQTLFRADILTSLPENGGSSCLIMLRSQVNRDSFRHQFEQTELPTLLGKGHYGTRTLEESYFDTDSSDSMQSMDHRQKIFLVIGLLSALLVLITACFNYVNLSFSRLLKQVKMIRIESLMGATTESIRQQLFWDTFLTVFIAFLLSVLLMNDLLPVFNSLVSAHLTLDFLFSSQVFPLILLFVLVLSVIPALYMSRKMNGISESNYRHFFSGGKRRMIVSLLVVFQFVISTSLLMAFGVIRSQLSLIEEEGDRYRGVVELNAFPVVVNETFVQTFVPNGENPTGQPLQKYIQEKSVNKGIIVGVAEDFKTLSLSVPVFPMRFSLQETPDEKASYLSVKIDASRRAETLATIQQLWEKHYLGRPFACTHIDEKFLSNNQEITHFSRLLLFYSITSLLLTAFGLFGIAWYAAEQRRREIGIRKVNGASTRQIVLLLNRSFFCYAAIAALIALPITYGLMQYWLEQFVYRTTIGAEAFLFPLLVTFVVTLLTVSLNSWQAASVNPVEAIKE